MARFAAPRLIVFVLITVLALAMLGVDAHYTHVLIKVQGMTFIEGLGLAGAFLTIVSMPIIIFSPAGSFLASVLFEIVWLSTLWVFWLLTAAIASSTRASFMEPLGSRGCSQLNGELFTLCVELPAIEGLAYAVWVLSAYLPSASILPISDFSTTPVP
ncbi:hypothetical protein PLEOSDRAFT_1107126 [Pleurotus ostreatus PC15]|uniref:MARVEL domain-containing protein n=1 Tax=Pleurotus ostreatus (strain PC15) TaxID=1137138 RepID=A0A067N8K9_PLEO1|nr:hypothetical protein PLEOSDRAFT_1107126 [Pleurotus ostreatus PC15]